MKGRWIMALLAVSAARLPAQDDCFPGSASNEARTMAILAVPLAFSSAGGLPGGWTVGIEGAVLPEVPPDLATPTACRPGKGPENTNPLPGFGRLRLGYARGSWQAEVGWIPPVRVSGVRANLVGLALGHRTRLAADWTALLRGHALLGTLHAPITCPDEALQDPGSECFDGSRSDDRWRPGVAGLEAAARYQRGPWMVHFGGGWSHLRPRFQVDFTNADGVRDRRRVSADLDRVAVFVGAGVTSPSWMVISEAYATVHDRVTLRLVVRRTLRDDLGH